MRNAHRLPPVASLLLALLGASAAIAAAAAQGQAPTTARPPLAPPGQGIALALSGSGFLGLFFTGAVAQLQELGLVTRATPVTGTSGGSLVAMTNCLGLSPDQAAFVANGIAAHCRAHRSCAGTLDAAVRAAVALAVDTAAGPGATQEQKDALVRDRCAGVATAVITRLVPTAPPAPAAAAASTAAAAPAPAPPTFSETVAWHVSDFGGAADLAAAGAASSFVPWFSGDAAYTTFRDAPAMDGGFKEMLPPCSQGAEAAAAAAAGGSAPPPCVRLISVPPGSVLMPGLPALPADADIAPGKYGIPLPGGMTSAQWGAYALSAPDEGVGALMLEHGRQQAMAWAREAYPEAVAGAAAAAGGAVAGGEPQEQLLLPLQPLVAAIAGEAPPTTASDPPAALDAADARRKARKLLST